MPPPLEESAALPASTASRLTPEERRARLEEEVVGLFDEFRNPLLRYLASFGLHTADGEELLQEVFLGLLQHLERGRPRDNLRGWLFRVAHNLALKRRSRTRRDRQSRAPGVEVRAIDPEPNPEDQLAGRQARDRLLAIVDALPEQDRRCLFLRAEGLRYREIAEVLNISLGAVSQSLSRSVARMARATQRG